MEVYRMRTLDDLTQEANLKIEGHAQRLRELLDKYVEKEIVNLFVAQPDTEKILLFIDDFSTFLDFARSNDRTILISKPIVLKTLEKFSNFDNGMKCWFTNDKLKDIWVSRLLSEDVKSIESIKLIIAFKNIDYAECLVKGHNSSAMENISNY